jgi:hypothetical protein
LFGGGGGGWDIAIVIRIYCEIGCKGSVTPLFSSLFLNERLQRPRLIEILAITSLVIDPQYSISGIASDLQYSISDVISTPWFWPMFSFLIAWKGFDCCLLVYEVASSFF